jgi:putative Holliday junction resolvase
MTIASIDVGLKRIGTAISFDNSIVFPTEPIIRKNRLQAASDVSSFLKNWNVSLLIVGLPHGSSSSDEMQRRIKHFTSLLTYNGHIVYVDEYGTSLQAKESTKGIFKHKKDGRIDSMAAKIILENYLLLQ